MTLNSLKQIFSDNGCLTVYVKTLAANDNSKNQVYLGESMELLNVFSGVETTAEEEDEPEEGNRKTHVFKVKLNYSWIHEDGHLYPAPDAKLILYPQYPEVRFSGFLNGCAHAPSELMTKRLPGRLLFLSLSRDKQLLGYVSHPDSEITREFNQLKLTDYLKFFKVLTLPQVEDTREKLLNELRRIRKKNWIQSKRLLKDGSIVPCGAPNCGGYTLEAELGISANGFSEPDFLGWEIKQFSVKSFTRLNSAVITLMTPEPTGGYYIEKGPQAFIEKYGYPDKKGRSDRKNFGGIHKFESLHPTTRLIMKLDGFDNNKNIITDPAGQIALVDSHQKIAASWSFAQLLQHWIRKHNQACYIPSIPSSHQTGTRGYKYGHTVILGTGTSFELFLKQIALGNTYYDPGIKMEFASTVRPEIKRRSQFRIKSGKLAALYYNSELVSL